MDERELEGAPLIEETRRQRNVEKGFTPRRATILPILVLYFCSTGISFYVVPEYTQSRVTSEEKSKLGIDLNSENQSQINQCENASSQNSSVNTRIQQESAKWNMYFSVAELAPALVANVFFGTYSDVKGRKFMLCLCTLGMTLKFAIITVVVYYSGDFLYIIIGEIVEGCAGSFTASFSVAFSFVADITDPGKWRTTMIVLFELLFGLTITISSLVTGYLIEYIGYFYTMLLCTILCALSCILCIALLPETRQRPDNSTSVSMLTTIANSWSFYFNAGSKLLRTKYRLLILSFAFLAITRLNSATLETIYQMGSPYCWSPKKISWFATTKLGTASIAGIVGTYVLQKYVSDAMIAVIGTSTGALSYVVEGLATTNAVMYTVPAFSCLAYLGFPMIRSLMSHQTSPDKQGALFAGISVMETLSSLLGALTNGIVYSATMTIMNGFVFLVLAFLSFTSTGILIAYIFVDKYHKHEVYNQPSSESTNGAGDEGRMDDERAA